MRVVVACRCTRERGSSPLRSGLSRVIEPACSTYLGLSHAPPISSRIYLFCGHRRCPEPPGARHGILSACCRRHIRYRAKPTAAARQGLDVSTSRQRIVRLAIAPFSRRVVVALSQDGYDRGQSCQRLLRRLFRRPAREAASSCADDAQPCSGLAPCGSDIQLKLDPSARPE